MTRQLNRQTKLKDGSLVMLSVYIQTPMETESFPFTEQGLKEATKLYTKYAKEIRSDNEDYTVSMFSDDGIAHIEYITVHQLTKNKKLVWNLFLTGFYC
jgi:hypothetical protein